MMKISKYSDLIPMQTYTMRYGKLLIALRFVYHKGEASKFRIIGNNTDQAIYLPKSMIEVLDGKYLRGQDWFWNRYSNKHKLMLAGIL